MGKRTVCTPETIKTITDGIKMGLSNTDSVILGGISKATFYGWLVRGEKELARVAEEGGGIAPLEQPFVDFIEGVNRAIPERKLILIGRIQMASQGSGQATETRRIFKRDDEGNNVLAEEIVTTKSNPAYWQAAAWLLERLHPTEFGRRQTIEFKDWRDTLPEGLNPDKVEQQFVDLMTLAAEQAENDSLTDQA